MPVVLAAMLAKCHASCRGWLVRDWALVSLNAFIAPGISTITIAARLAFGSAAVLLLCSCEKTVVDPATNPTATRAVNANQPAILQTDPRREREQQQVRSPLQEPSMRQPDPKMARPPAKSPAPPPAKPRRVILPSPTQPPAEIDPVQPYPGDKVPG